MEMQDGLYKMSQKQYNKIPAINWSTLKKMINRTPYAFKKLVIEEEASFELTPDMLLGSVVHMMILEPHLVDRYVLNKIEGNGQKTEVKEARALQASQNPDALIVTSEQRIIAQAMTQSIQSNEHFDNYLSNGKAEITLVWTDEETGLKCKGRLDYVNSNAICDVKTTKEISPQGFSDSCFDSHYFGQAAFYLNGWKALKGTDQDFIFAAISKAEPFESWFSFVNEDQISYGKKQVSKLLREYKKHSESGIWPKMDGICELKVSAWRQKLINEFILDN